MAKELKITPRQRKFIDEYLVSLNATDAAKKAGYSEDTAYQAGLKNLSKPHIRAEIDRVLQEVSSDKVATVQEILEFLTAGMRGQHKELITLGVGGGEQKLVEVPMPTKDRIRCAELLGKRYALFTEKIEMDTLPVIIMDDVGKWDEQDEFETDEEYERRMNSDKFK